MPTVVVQTPPTATAEPVSLALLNAALRLDYDSTVIAAYEAGSTTSLDPALVAQLDLLSVYRSGAREKVEAYTQRFYATQQLAITYELGEGYLLPGGATAVSVSGFFTTLADLEAYNSEEYRKGISVNRELPWGQAMQQTYTVIADTTGDPQYANLAKSAILELVGEWYHNRETTVAGVAVISELPVSWKVKLAQAVINPWGG